jgi:hypothetical protein
MPPKKGKKEKGGEKKGKKEPVEERPRILDWSNPSWKFAAKAGTSLSPVSYPTQMGLRP